MLRHRLPVALGLAALAILAVGLRPWTQHVPEGRGTAPADGPPAPASPLARDGTRPSRGGDTSDDLPAAGETLRGRPPAPPPGARKEPAASVAAEQLDGISWADHVALFDELTSVMLTLEAGRDDPPASALARMARFMSDLQTVEGATGATSARAAAESPEVRSRLLIEAARAAGSTDPEVRARVLALIRVPTQATSHVQALSTRLSVEWQMFNASLATVPEGQRDQFLHACYSLLLWGSLEVNLSTDVHDAETAEARLFEALLRLYRPQLDDRGVQEAREICRDWVESAAREIQTLRGIHGDRAVLAVIGGERGAWTLPVHLDLRARMADVQARHLPGAWRARLGERESGRGVERTLIIPGYY